MKNFIKNYKNVFYYLLIIIIIIILHFKLKREWVKL